jgi:hypothetical protein
MAENEIVFEDLRGVHEEKPVTIDLDADTKGDGITRTPAGQAADDDAGNDDALKIDDLRSGDDDPLPEDDKKKSASSDSVDDDYSKKVKARIQRATRATKSERDRGDYWENEAKRLAKDSYDRDKSSAETIIAQADTQIATTQDQLKTAIEDGKTDDQVRLTSQLTDQKAAKIQAAFSLDNLSPDGNVQPFSGKVTTKKSDDPSIADDWMESRSDWYGAKGFERQTRLANRIDKEVHADEFDPSTEEYFEELDRRIKAKEPGLYDDTKGDDDHAGDKSRGRRRSPVAGVDRGTEGHRSSRRGNKVELGEEDFANMRRFHLDPNDPEVLKEYARNKQESDLGDQR